MGQKASTCSLFVGESGKDKCGVPYNSEANFCHAHSKHPTTMVPVCWVDGGSASKNLVRFNDGTQTACKTTGSRGDVLLRFNTVPATKEGTHTHTGLPYCGISRQNRWPQFKDDPIVPLKKQ